MNDSKRQRLLGSVCERGQVGNFFFEATRGREFFIPFTFDATNQIIE